MRLIRDGDVAHHQRLSTSTEQMTVAGEEWGEGAEGGREAEGLPGAVFYFVVFEPVCLQQQQNVGRQPSTEIQEQASKQVGLFMTSPGLLYYQGESQTENAHKCKSVATCDRFVRDATLSDYSGPKLHCRAVVGVFAYAVPRTARRELQCSGRVTVPWTGKSNRGTSSADDERAVTWPWP